MAMSAQPAGCCLLLLLAALLVGFCSGQSSCPGESIRVCGSLNFPDDSSPWVTVSGADDSGNAAQLWLSQKYAYVFTFNTAFYTFSLQQRTPIPPGLNTSVAVSPSFSSDPSAQGPIVVLVPKSSPWTLVEVIVSSQGWVFTRNLTIPQFASSVEWQKIVPNIYGLTSKLYLLSSTHLVIINYNALLWNIVAVVPLPAQDAQYPMPIIRSASVNANNQQQLFVTRGSTNPARPGEFLLLSADDGSLINRVILDRSPPVTFVTEGALDGTNDIIWAESGTLFSAQQNTGAVFMWSLKNHDLEYVEVPVGASEAFGAAYGSTPNNKYLLLGYGNNTAQEYSLVSINIPNTCVMDLKKAFQGTTPEAGREVGNDILEQTGLALFGNRYQGANQVTLIYYASWF